MRPTRVFRAVCFWILIFPSTCFAAPLFQSSNFVSVNLIPVVDPLHVLPNNRSLAMGEYVSTQRWFSDWVLSCHALYSKPTRTCSIVNRAIRGIAFRIGLTVTNRIVLRLSGGAMFDAGPVKIVAGRYIFHFPPPVCSNSRCAVEVLFHGPISDVFSSGGMMTVYFGPDANRIVRPLSLAGFPESVLSLSAPAG